MARGTRVRWLALAPLFLAMAMAVPTGAAYAAEDGVVPSAPAASGDASGILADGDGGGGKPEEVWAVVSGEDEDVASAAGAEAVSVADAATPAAIDEAPVAADTPDADADGTALGDADRQEAYSSDEGTHAAATAAAPAPSAAAATDAQVAPRPVGSAALVAAGSVTSSAKPTSSQTSAQATSQVIAQASATTAAQTAKATAAQKAKAAVAPTTLAGIAALNKGGVLLAEGAYTLTAVAGKALDVAGGSGANSANVQMYSSNGTMAQAWEVRVDANGYVTLLCLGSGKALDVAGGRAVRGTNVQQYASNGSKAQKWALEKVGDCFVMRSALGNGLVLDVAGGSAANGTNVQVYTSNGTVAQRWRFALTASGRIAQANRDGSVLASGTYVVQFGNNYRVLDVAGGSKANSANVQSYSANGTAAQTWKVSVDRSGYVTLTSAISGKALDVAGGRVARGTNVQQYASNGTAAQRWAAERRGGSIVLHAAANASYVLDVCGASTSSGANVQLYANNNTAAQRWNFWPVAPKVAKAGRTVADGVYVMRAVSGMVAEVTGGSIENGAKVRSHAANGTGAQAWWVTLASDGYYRIRSALSSKMMETSNVVIPGGDVHQQSSNASSANQRWVIRRNADGTYAVVSARNALALTAAASNNADSTRAYTGGGTQRWTFVAAPSPTFADGWYKVASVSASGKVLDLPNGSVATGRSLQIYSPNGSQAQSLWLRRHSGNAYSVQVSCSGLYLTDTRGSRVVQAGDAGNMSRWRMDYNQNGGYTLSNVGSGRVIELSGGGTGNGTPVALAAKSTPAVRQAWTISKATSGVKAGFYELVLTSAQSQRLEVAGGSKDARANVRSYASNGTLAQRWWVRAAEGDRFTITNCASALNLDVTNASSSAGTNVQQFTKNGSAAQKWYFTMGTHGLEVRSAVSGLVLEVAGTPKSGSNVRVNKAGASSSQGWRLSSAKRPAKMGWQNPSDMYQVSSVSVTLTDGVAGFDYASPSALNIEATRSQVVEAFIARAYQYLGTPYVWDHTGAPGTGIDCAGLVAQCMYAVGITHIYTPYRHRYDPWQDHNANNMRLSDSRIKNISLSGLRRGDLVFYNGHVSIYLGSSQVIEAYPSKVRVASMYAAGRPVCGGRLFA